MRVAKMKKEGIHEGDLTPMIDMTFQLIAFFMVLINFTQSEQNDKVQLPKSELAKPPEAPLEKPIVVHFFENGEDLVIEGKQMSVDRVSSELGVKRDAFVSAGESISDVTIVIRAHQNAPTGKVQLLIKKCQDAGFENFALRAEEDVGN